MATIVQPGLYRHFKGNLYRVTEIAKHSESQEPMVVYQALYGDKGWWVRPLSMFDEMVNRGGQKQRRFSRCDEQTLSLEIAILNVKAGQNTRFEAAFSQAEVIIKNAQGYLGHELRRCEERVGQYVLLVHWQTTAHHNDGFRGSEAYQHWRELLHHFYQPMPTVEHYQPPLAMLSETF